MSTDNSPTSSKPESPQSIEVDCSGWGDEAAKPVSKGKFVALTETKTPIEVDCSKWGDFEIEAVPISGVAWTPAPVVEAKVAGLSEASLAVSHRGRASRRLKPDFLTGSNALLTAERLRERARKHGGDLSFVHVVPFEVFEEMDLNEWRRTTDTFSKKLGAAAAPILHRDLRIGVALGDVGPEGLRIGIGSGRTIYGLFEALPHMACRGVRVRIEQLVSVPLPADSVSSSTIVEMAAEKFSNAAVNYVTTHSISGPEYRITQIPLNDADVQEFRWLITGIGGPTSKSVADELQAISHGDETDEVTAAICCRLLDSNGNEIHSRIRDVFVRIRLHHLEMLAKHGSRRVVAVAGGLGKVKAIATVLRKKPRIINTLITDELTARMLIRELRRDDHLNASVPSEMKRKES